MSVFLTKFTIYQILSLVYLRIHSFYVPSTSEVSDSSAQGV